MTKPGQPEVLSWTDRVLSADDLRRHLNGHREIQVGGGTIITPLALEELRSRGVRLARGAQPGAMASTCPSGSWGHAQEKDDPLVAAAVKSLRGEGVVLNQLKPPGAHPALWARGLAEIVVAEGYLGAVAICGDAALVACVANKVAGIRAAAVAGKWQAEKALASLGANLLVVEMPGRTVHEVRQILKAAAGHRPNCPPTLAEIEGHAHR